MAKLIFESRVTEQKANTTFTFRHGILYLAAGSYRGFDLSYDDPGGGSVQGYDNARAAWRTLSLAIQGTKSLRFSMPKDPDIEKFYSEHTELGKAIDHLEILAFTSSRPRTWDSFPDFSIDIFDVTVVPGVLTIQGVTTVGLQFSGATKQWY